LGDDRVLISNIRFCWLMVMC